MLRNISNFFNIIKGNRVKTTLSPGDLISVGTRDRKDKSTYYDSAIKFSDLEAQVATAGAQGPPGADGPAGPQGDPGPAGPVGAAGLVFTGTWNPATSYIVGDVVFYNGSSYVCSNPITSATPPDTDTANWDFLALQGLQGPAGPGGFSVSDTGRVDTGVSTGQFLFRSFLIPANSFALGDVFHVEAMFIKLTGHSFIYKAYVNTSNTLMGADLLWQTDFQSSRRYMNTVYTLMIDRAGPGDTTTGCSTNNNAVTSGFSQYGNAGGNHAIDWSVDQYILIAGVNSSAVNPTTNIGAKIW